MFTRCPACLTQFRVRAQHLTAAGGRVRCGACGQAFDAVSRLSDQPMPPVTDPYNHASEPLRSYDTELEEFDLPQGLHSGVDADTATPGSVAVEVDWPEAEDDQQVSRHTGR